eukprot:TRINITY_DN3976_c0_g1_i1.p1 TRINITY_DN3976_c0_g1~~TRINITY_DN3976_c0_g1_i1.p1  ORF type:complete len:507 (-),score=91.17 TRINITY_DN3976_c0_g1_i1:131-1651(-)
MKMMKSGFCFYYCIVCLLLIFSVVIKCDQITSTQTVRPGFKTMLSRKAINYFKAIGLDIMQDNIHNIQIPDISGSTDTRVGSFSYLLQDTQILELEIGSSELYIVESSGLQLIMNNVTVEINMSWSIQEQSWPYFTDHGTSEISILDSNIFLTSSVWENDGSPAINVTYSDVEIGSLELLLYGKAAWIYNLFVDLFANEIKSAMQTALDMAIQQSMNSGVNEVLSSLPKRQNFGGSDYVQVDYALVSAPQFIGNEFATLEHKGEFYFVANPREAPFVPPILPDSIPTTEMVQMYVSDYVMNTAGYSYWKSGNLRITITDGDIPNDSPMRLNTTYFQDMVDPLYDHFPDMMVELEITVAQTPVMLFHQNGAELTATTFINVNVIEPNDTVTLAFTLNTQVFCVGIASLVLPTPTSSPVIKGQLEYLNSTLSLKYSNIGYFDVSVLQSFVNYILEEMVLPDTNDYLNQGGFPLPVLPGVYFINPELLWAERYLIISTDVEYLPFDNKI